MHQGCYQAVDPILRGLSQRFIKTSIENSRYRPDLRHLIDQDVGSARKESRLNGDKNGDVGSYVD
jgi:hypothetical protein